MIGHLNTNLAWGGGENQVLQLLRGLQAAGDPVVLFAPAAGLLARRAREAGLPVEPLPWPARLGWPAAWRLLLGAARRRGVTLWHAHDSRGLGVASALARRMGVPLVLTRRVASPLRNNPRSRRKYAPDRIAAVIAISETVRDVFAQSGYPKDRIFVAPSGLDLARLEAWPEDTEWRQRWPDARRVVGLGKLAPKKNWELMIRTAARWRAQHPDRPVAWILLGDGPERARLAALARALGVGDTVHFLGFVPDAGRLMKQADALFFPSVREGASVTVREAMALGVPVVAVNSPAVVESLDGHGWLIGAQDEAAGVRALEEVLDQPAVRDARVAAARASARARFDLRHTVESTRRVYARIALRARQA